MKTVHFFFFIVMMTSFCLIDSLSFFSVWKASDGNALDFRERNCGRVSLPAKERSRGIKRKQQRTREKEQESKRARGRRKPLFLLAFFQRQERKAARAREQERRKRKKTRFFLLTSRERDSRYGERKKHRRRDSQVRPFGFVVTCPHRTVSARRGDDVSMTKRDVIIREWYGGKI